jgi:uncharacterized protein (TIGR00730 family)
LQRKGKGKMRIAVYCGSGFGKRQAYRDAAEEVGSWIAEHGYELIYGGSERGLMGIVANAALKHHGTVIGVEPEFFLEEGLKHKGITKTIPCKTMSERKAIMMNMSDAYIALPGGPGTLDEISEVIVLSHLGREHKPCILYNKEDYYDALLAFYDQMVDEEFSTPENRKKILAVRNTAELEQIFSNNNL